MKGVGALAPAPFMFKEGLRHKASAEPGSLRESLARDVGDDASWPRGNDMKATIERATLLKGLSHVQSVVERRNTIPILSNVLIEATAEGGLKLMATDLDLQINETVAAAVDQPGATTVSAHTLFDICRKLPEGSQVSLAAADGKLTIMAGRAKFQLGTLPRDDFPVIAEGELPVSFELGADALKKIIDKTRFAISTEETRYYLNGIFLHVSDDPEPGAEGRSDRRTPAGTLHAAAAGRGGGDARRHHSAQMRGGIAQIARRDRRVGRRIAVADQDPLRPGAGFADLEADRRYFSRLQPRYSNGQRQDPQDRSAQLRRRRRPRLDHRDRKDARSEDGTGARQDRAVGHIAGKTARRRRKSPANMSPAGSRSDSTAAICSTYWGS